MEKKAFKCNDWLKPIARPLKFAFVPKNVHSWYDPVQEGIQKAVAELKQLGVMLEIKWDAPPVADVNLHREKMIANLSARPDGLAIACLAPTTDTRIINDAVKAGLHVITFDTDAPDSLRKTYVGHSGDYQDGYELAEFLAEKIHHTGKVTILTGNLTAPNHVGRVNGFKAGIARYNNIEVVLASPDSDDIEKAEQLTELALRTYPDIKGFFCCNAVNPIGCARRQKNKESGPNSSGRDGRFAGDTSIHPGRRD